MRMNPAWVIASLTDGDTLPLIVAAFEALASDESLAFHDAMPKLRQLRNHLALHVAIMDLGGRWTLSEVTGALTDCADAAVKAALEIALRKSIASGRWKDLPGGSAAEQSGMTILAMGKHGAGELNYSSDIDLIVLFDPSIVPVKAGVQPLDTCVRVVQDIVTLLDQKTADGHVFRVDLRLRPDPASTPAAIPIGSAFSYYESLGQNWERAALIKARAVAGDIELGQGFLRDLGPFIWRKYFDYAAIADIHAMKRQIYAHKGHEVIAVEGHDIKLGRGGIREIEFFVQTQQLIYGGRRPNLRGNRTLDVLVALERDGWIDQSAVAELSAAYVFLRTLEHRLQMMEDEQTQRLPREKADLDLFARFCGFDPRGFRKNLLKHLRNVETHYAKLFEEAEGLSAKTGSLVFTGTSDDPDTLIALRRMGFDKPELATETIRGWHFGRRQAIRTPRAREALTEFVPAILKALGNSGDPDGGLAAFDDALARMPAAVELLAILKQNQALLALFAQLLGSAPRLADIIAQRPHVLDFLLDPEFVRAPDLPAVDRRITNVLSRAKDFEAFLNQARELAYAEKFLIGARVMSRLIDPLEAGPAHTVVAEAFLRQAVLQAEAEMALRHGRVPGGRMTVLGFGKLGSREMTAASDLDLVIIFDALPDAVSDGDRHLSATEYYSRATQRLITALSAETARGILYDIDLRLRPSGRKGPVATSLAGFVAYQMGDAETWEHMALTRARAVAGDRSLCIEVETAIDGILAVPRSRARIARDVIAMRRLVAKEKGDARVWDLKQARGGLLDVEFTAQFIILVHAGSGLIFSTNPGEAIAQAVASGVVLAEHGARLIEGWRFYSSLTQFLRLSLHEAFDPASATPVLKQGLATAMAVPDFRVLEGQLLGLQKDVRSILNAVLGSKI